MEEEHTVHYSGPEYNPDDTLTELVDALTTGER